MRYKISIDYLHKFIQNPFETIQKTNFSFEEFVLHKVLTSTGNKCFEIIRCHLLKHEILNGSKLTPKIEISNKFNFENRSNDVIVTLHPLHFEYLLVGDGKTDLYISKIILDQLVLLYSQNDQKIVNDVKNSFSQSVNYIKNKKIKSTELIEKMREYKKIIEKTTNNFPKTLFHEITEFFKTMMENEFVLKKYFSEIENLYINLLYHPINELRSISLILLNCLYDGNLNGMKQNFFIEKISQVGDNLILDNTFKQENFINDRNEVVERSDLSDFLNYDNDLFMQISIPSPKKYVKNLNHKITFYMLFKTNIGKIQTPGEYDVIIGKLSDYKFVEIQYNKKIVMSRTIVLPCNTSNINIYSISKPDYSDELLTKEIFQHFAVNTIHIIGNNMLTIENSFMANIIGKIKNFDFANLKIMIDFPINDNDVYDNFIHEVVKKYKISDKTIDNNLKKLIKTNNNNLNELIKTTDNNSYNINNKLIELIKNNVNNNFYDYDNDKSNELISNNVNNNSNNNINNKSIELIKNIHTYFVDINSNETIKFNYNHIIDVNSNETVKFNYNYVTNDQQTFFGWEKYIEKLKYIREKYNINMIRLTSKYDILIPLIDVSGEKKQIYKNELLNCGYPNPFLRKLSCEMWKIDPKFIIFTETQMKELKSSLGSCVIPFINDLKPLLSPKFKTIYNLFMSNDELNQLEKQLYAEKYPEKYAEKYTEKYPCGAVFAHQINSPHPSLLHFLYFSPIIFSLTPLNLYDKKYIDLNKKRSLIKKRIGYLLESNNIETIQLNKKENCISDKTFGIVRENVSSKIILLITINISDKSTTIYPDLSNLKLKNKFCDNDIFEVIDIITHKRRLISYSELKKEQIKIDLDSFDIHCLKFALYKEEKNGNFQDEYLHYSFKKCMTLMKNKDVMKGNMVYEKISSSLLHEDEEQFSNFIKTLYNILDEQNEKNIEESLIDLIQTIFFKINKSRELNGRNTMIHGLKVLKNLSYKTDICGQIANMVLKKNELGPIVFITPELGRFSTIGGIGVLMNELTKILSELGNEIIVISPYYNMNKKGEQNYLIKEGIKQIGTVTTTIANEQINCGLHYMRENNIDLYFLHNYTHFPVAYPSFGTEMCLKSTVLFNKSSLQLMIDKQIKPSLVITNDWFTGLVSGYAKNKFDDYFKDCKFFHIIHNFEKGYVGDLYPNFDLTYIHELPPEFLNSPDVTHINLSKCALKCSDNWGTVSKTYMKDILEKSEFSYYLKQYKKPFACSNGISVEHRKESLRKISPSLNHIECKRKLQEKYFKNIDDSIPLFGFIGRICEQKGVHILLKSITQIIEKTNNKCQFIVGGMASMDDPYGIMCIKQMKEMNEKYKNCFWSDPKNFFTDGLLMNLGCDFMCMPSLFEPSGLVQQECFVAGTPVIAFQTGGLKDTVHEYNLRERKGNGLVFQSFSVKDLTFAIQRSLKIYNNKEEYEILRNNASESVLDLLDVAINWCSEFARLKKKIYIF